VRLDESHYILLGVALAGFIGAAAFQGRDTKS